MTSPYYIGIDIGGTKIGVSRFDIASSCVVDAEQFASSSDCDPKEAFAKINQIAGGWISRCGQAPRAIGVSVGGMFDMDAGCMQHAPHLPRWDGFPIVSTLQQSFRVPVFADNDANACALAEWQHGAGRGCDHLVFLTFGTGLGAGLILNGQLYRGANGLAGEVGNVRVADSGPPIREKPGCLEGFASGAGIALLAAEMKQRYPGSLLPMQPTAKDVTTAVRQGDEAALAVLQTCGKRLGEGLAILIDVLNPQRIILGSIFARCEALLRPAMEEAIAEQSVALSCGVCEIRAAELGDAIGDYAAATLAQVGERLQIAN